MTEKERCDDCKVSCKGTSLCDVLQETSITNDESAILGKILKFLSKEQRPLSLPYIKLRYGLAPVQMESIISVLTIMEWVELSDVFSKNATISITQKGLEFIRNTLKDYLQEEQELEIKVEERPRMNDE